MSNEHRKPLAAFIVLMFLVAGIVGVKKADAQAGRLLVAAVGAGVRVEGALPGASESEPDASTAAVAGPAFAALVDPSRVHGPGTWTVADVLPGPVQEVGRGAADAARWATHDAAPTSRALVRASASAVPWAGRRAPGAVAAAEPRRERLASRVAPAVSRARKADSNRPKATASSARQGMSPTVRPARTITTRPVPVAHPAPKAPTRKPACVQKRQHSTRVLAGPRGPRAHRHVLAHRGRHGHGHARAAARR